MINKDLLSEAPIDHYYETFQTEGRKIIQEVVRTAFQKTKVGLETLFAKIEENKQLKQKLNAKRGKKEDIKHLNSQNHLIQVGCIFLVGLPFLFKYAKNKKTIQQLKQAAKEDKQQISANEAVIFEGKIALLTEIKMDELVANLFTAFGFNHLDNFDYERVANLVRTALTFDSRIATSKNGVDEPRFIGFDKVTTVSLNNRPIYDVTASILTYQETFIRANEEPDCEYYLKHVPKIEKIRWIFGLSNFQSPLSIGLDHPRLFVYYNERDRALKLMVDQEKKALGITTETPDDYRLVDWKVLLNQATGNLKAWSELYRHEAQLVQITTMKQELKPPVAFGDHPEFDDTFKYAWSGAEADLHQLFTPFTQEKIAKWFAKNRLAWTGLGWNFQGGEGFTFNKKEENPASYTDVYHYLGIKKNDLREAKIEDLQAKLVEKLVTYFTEWFNRTQWLFLFSGVAKEWYNHNLYYTTIAEATEWENDADRQIETQQFPSNGTILGMAGADLFINHKVLLQPWLDLDNLNCFQFSDHVTRNDVNLESFVVEETAELGEQPTYATITEPKIVYTLTKEIPPKEITIRFDHAHPHGFIDGNLEEINHLPATYQKLFDQMQEFFKQHQELLQYAVLEWQKNYGFLAINDVKAFELANLEDELETWLNQLVDWEDPV